MAPTSETSNTTGHSSASNSSHHGNNNSNGNGAGSGWIHSFFYPPPSKRDAVHASNDQARVLYAMRHMNIAVPPPPSEGPTGESASSSHNNRQATATAFAANPQSTNTSSSRHGNHSTIGNAAGGGGGGSGSGSGDNGNTIHAVMNENFDQQEEEDDMFVIEFWRTYDDIIVLALFTQIGILARLGVSTWFTYFDTVFSADSALFVTLPLNSLSCFLMGLLCSGDRLMEIISTRFTPPHLQQDLFQHGDEEEEEWDDEQIDVLVNQAAASSPVHRRLPAILRRRHQRIMGTQKAGSPRRKKHHKQSYFRSWQPPVQLNQELRDVQLLALERRIRASKCLLLFPVKKEEIDVVEDYFRGGYRRDDDDDEDVVDEEMNSNINPHEHDLALQEETVPRTSGPRRVADSSSPTTTIATTSVKSLSPPETPTKNESVPIDPLESNKESAKGGDAKDINGMHTVNLDPPKEEESDIAQQAEDQMDQTNNFDQIVQDVQANVSENISRFRRVNLASGWDVGTTASEMSDDLLLGLRDGFCGALSSFSSWNSAMVTLLKQEQVGQAIVGYMLGLQLPIIAYRFGQHVAVYIFAWRCRQEARRDERRGYGIRIDQSESEDDMIAAEDGSEDSKERELPSVRAVLTALFIMALIAQCVSLAFLQNPDHLQLAMSLLFSPLGVYARWRLSKLNRWKPTFPLGTFTANMLACALSGSLGALLAGDPGPRERIVLVSIIAGFGGTLSSVAAFITEILAGIDPILFRFDGFTYAIVAILSAVVVGFVFSPTADWADQTIPTDEMTTTTTTTATTTTP